MAENQEENCERSQKFTVSSSEKILVDRKKFEELLVLVEWCARELIIYQHRDSNSFLAALDSYLSSESLETSDTFAFLLLDYYCDSIPKALNEIDNRLEKAKQILQNFTALNELFRGR
jgi:hypothetical protein